ncbi:class I SAM-dependent methyltransferase [Anatilimnocola floriformis]|uniref:class I SAM-dependent methyltransferase n=1 Tax=Anatilimnocola floriformis TaxID=2948575 RepID=UPI0020C21FE4|nr:methyltransferase domain-containing protein [Anatilimnocola floriformis]
MQRLNWGCGPLTPFGWINSDIAAGPGVDVVADILQGLPFPDNHFDYIVSIHVLPELAYRELDPALHELRRVLKPGGILRLSLPDLDLAINAYRNKDIDYFLIGDDEVKSLSGKMIVQLLWYGRSRSMFTWEFTKELLERAGYSEVTRCAHEKSASGLTGITDLDNRALESLFVEARK